MNKEKNNPYILIGSIALLILASHIIFLNYILYVTEPVKAASVGDSFGSLNSLFSGLAFAILIGTIYLQKNELELQRQELSLTREEIRLTREEHKKSSHAAELSAKYFHEQAEAMKLDNEIGILGQLLSVYHEEEKRIENLPEFNEGLKKRKYELRGVAYRKREKLQNLLEEHYNRLTNKS